MKALKNIAEGGSIHQEEQDLATSAGGTAAAEQQEKYSEGGAKVRQLKWGEKFAPSNSLF